MANATKSEPSVHEYQGAGGRTRIRMRHAGGTITCSRSADAPRAMSAIYAQLRDTEAALYRTAQAIAEGFVEGMALGCSSQLTAACDDWRDAARIFGYELRHPNDETTPGLLALARTCADAALARMRDIESLGRPLPPVVPAPVPRRVAPPTVPAAAPQPSVKVRALAGGGHEFALAIPPAPAAPAPVINVAPANVKFDTAALADAIANGLSRIERVAGEAVASQRASQERLEAKLDGLQAIAETPWRHVVKKNPDGSMKEIESKRA